MSAPASRVGGSGNKVTGIQNLMNFNTLAISMTNRPPVETGIHHSPYHAFRPPGFTAKPATPGVKSPVIANGETPINNAAPTQTGMGCWPRSTKTLTRLNRPNHAPIGQGAETSPRRQVQQYGSEM